MAKSMLERLNAPVEISACGAILDGDLSIPAGAKGFVVFAHGSGSSRRSPRNRFVAEALQKRGFGTLLFDLLTELEDQDFTFRFDIRLLSLRLKGAVEWLATHEARRGLPISLFGASTGAASALRVAAVMRESVACVVSRGGRPDLAGEDLGRVWCPTLLIVGGDDSEVISLNEDAMRRMPERTVKELAIVDGATHLFEEPGVLERVAQLAGDWLGRFGSR